MGLDITAVRKAVPTDKTEWEPDIGFVIASNANGYNRLDGFKPGYYLGQDQFDFRAGSYSGYNDWREWLCLTFLGQRALVVWENEKEYTGKPFIELICFGDNEGTFGPATSAKLAKDFQEHHEKARDFDGSWFYTKYCDWQQAFELASDGGLVDLH